MQEPLQQTMLDGSLVYEYKTIAVHFNRTITEHNTAQCSNLYPFPDIQHTTRSNRAEAKTTQIEFLHTAITCLCSFLAKHLV